MNELRKIEPDLIHIVNIKTLKGNIETFSGVDASEIKGHGFEFEIGYGLNREDRIVGIELTVNIEANNKEDIAAVKGSYTHEFIFKVENIEDFIEDIPNEEPNVDGLIVSTLVSIAYSTVRGIIFTRTQGTSLNAVILPVIDPKKIIKMQEEQQKNENID